MSLDLLDPVTPSEEEAQQAREAALRLARHLHHPQGIQLQVPGEAEGLPLPPLALRLLTDLLVQLAEGNAVTIQPTPHELTTQEAADYLNVSRPFLVGLLERGEIPFRKVGTHRRVRFADLVSYRKAINAQRRQVLDELAAEAQELGLGY
jgi:excisionase family DNA binding protein